MKEIFAALDFIGLVVSIFLFIGSFAIMGVGRAIGNEDYLYMLYPLFISTWGMWGAGSLVWKRIKGNELNMENDENTHE